MSVPHSQYVGTGSLNTAHSNVPTTAWGTVRWFGEANWEENDLKGVRQF